MLLCSGLRAPLAVQRARQTSRVCGSETRRSVVRWAEKGGSSFSDRFSSSSQVAYLEAAVPSDQRPVNELAQLKDDLLYSWGSLSMNDYVMRLGGVFAFFMALVGGPIAYQTFEPTRQPLEWVLSASVGSLVVVAIVVVRIFLGWSYVSDRLLSASYPYEETGWYDGQTFVKPPEVLTRDRLLGMYETKPVLQKLRVTLIGSGVALLASSVLLFGLINTESKENMSGPRQVTADSLIFSAAVTSMDQLMYDDEAAAAEAAAAGDIPGYCWDRYHRALAGGSVCEKWDGVVKGIN